MLVDAHSLIHRAYHALPPLRTRDGQPTQAVYGFTAMLIKLLQEERPEYVAVSFDLQGPTFRHQAFAGYKAQRPSMDDELASQIPLVYQVVESLRLPVHQLEGFEADDCLGTLARQGEALGLRVLLLTGDRDLLQLVDGSVSALLTRKGLSELERLDPPGVERLLGVPPEKVTDYKALVGDPSDNIPGVPGVGPKTAARLLAQYGSLEAVLDHAAEVAGRTGQALRENREAALQGKMLTTIRCDLPLELDLDRCRVRPPEAGPVRDLFHRLEFTSLLHRLGVLFPGAGLDGAGAEGGGTGGAGEGKEGEATGPGRSPEAQATVLADGAALARWLEDLPPGEPVAVEWLADGPDALAAPLVGVSVGRPGEVAYLPLDKGARNGLEALGELLASGRIKWVHDLKRQIHLGRRLGLELKPPAFDLLLAGYLLRPGEGRYDPGDLARRWLDDELPLLQEEVEGRGKKLEPLATVPPERLAGRLAARLRRYGALAHRLEAEMEQDGLLSLFREVELPLAWVLAGMEERGVRVDPEVLRRLSDELDGRIEALAEGVYGIAGERFNLNSPKQLGVILFERLGLPVLQRTKTGPSTSAEVLEELADQHEVAALILVHRQLVKLKGTYIDALPELIRPGTGRVHTTFHQTVAATGRLSSSDPNLQNIPIRTGEGEKIRAAFVPGEPGWVLLAADYSQIELRVLAHISGDPGLIDAFRSGMDIHTRTAAEVFGVAPEQVSSSMRTAAKAINFGIVYGISSYGLARGTGLSRAEAQAYIDGYFARYPGVRRYMDEVVEQARREGYVTTLLGRRRYLPDLLARDRTRRAFAERTAMNTPIQGSAADIIKLAMLRVDERLRQAGHQARMLLQVHDELVFECPQEEVAGVAGLVREAMEGVVSLEVPLRAEVEAGPNWLETRPVADS
ncbi:DNA polymerase I [Limnochorda pilosa]|uniref:DNA polymerase I n=1 Tax=Limnochorda pilosa TaxID=1555112 RepID=A0A0K2SJS4_LIMPI|nr:DNA polymerase I [Limnochorda pilosa]